MCGIVGAVGRGVVPEHIERALDAQLHRGPDGHGTWFAPGVALGHSRLKIIDISERGAQPMTSQDGRYTIVYNGEVYNYRELRTLLGSTTSFRSDSDTEVVLESFSRWGPACLDRFVGMYAFAVWDNVEQRLFCARDRLGIKPFHYALHQGRFLFSSEINGLLAAGVDSTPNESTLFDFLARDFYDHTNETFFRSVHRLAAASYMWVSTDGKATAPTTYWDLAQASLATDVSPDPRERESALLGLMREATALHLRSDVPVGVALSGGLDSSTLLAMLDETHPDPTKMAAFSFVTPHAEYSEQPYVEAMTRGTGRSSTFIDVTPDDLENWARPISRQQQEPFAGLPIIAYSLCFQAARAADYIVMMDGSGVDEALAGYDRFRPAFWADLLEGNRLDDLDTEWELCGVRTEAARANARRMIELVQRNETGGLGQDLTASVRPDCLTTDFTQAHEQSHPEFAAPFPDHLRNLMYRELRYTKLPRALRFRDRLSMAVGTELRPPFLDHRLLEYAFALPATDLISGPQGKVILRDSLAARLPETISRAAKRSVQTPQREWFRGELQGWVREQLADSILWEAGWVDRRAALIALEAFFNGEGDNSFFLWQWMNLGWWLEDREAPAASP